MKEETRTLVYIYLIDPHCYLPIKRNPRFLTMNRPPLCDGNKSCFVGAEEFRLAFGRWVAISDVAIISAWLESFPNTWYIYFRAERERDMRRWANSTREAITSTATAEEKKNRCGAQLSKWKSSSAQREYEKVNLLIAAAAPLVQINRTEFLCGQHFSLTACRRPQLIAWGTHKKKELIERVSHCGRDKRRSAVLQPTGISWAKCC